MKPKVKYLAVLTSLLGLVGFVLIYTQAVPTNAQAAEVVVRDGDVEWTSTMGEDVSFVEADADATFFIRDDHLEVRRSGTARFVSVQAGTKYINLATGAVGASESATTTVTVAFYSGGQAYEGASTPLVTDALATTIPGNFPLSVDADGGITPFGRNRQAGQLGC